MKKMYVLLFFIFTSVVGKAQRYWVGGTSGVWNSTANWSTTSGGGSGASIPGTGDNVFFDNSTGNASPTVTLANAIATLASLNFTSSNVTFSGAFGITATSVVLDASNATFVHNIQVNSSLTFSNTSRITLTAASNGLGLTIGNNTAFTLSGNSSTNYIDGNTNAYCIFNTTSALTVFFNPSATFAGIQPTRGIITLGSNVNTVRLLFGTNGTNSSQGLILNGNTLTVSSSGTNSFNATSNCQGIDASVTGSRVVITSSALTILNTANGNIIFKPSTTIENLQYNSSGTFNLPQALSVRNLTLTNGTINNVTNNITILNGGSISRALAAATLSAVPVFGSTVDINYTGTAAITTNVELPTSTTAINNLTINNSGGITLGAAATVNGTLTLTSGTFTNSNTLTIANGATISRATTSAALSAVPTFAGTVNVIYTNNANITTANELPNTTNSPLTTLNNLTLNSTGTSINVTLAAGAASIQINGVLALSGSSTGTLGVSSNTITFAGTSSITRTGNMSINASNVAAVLNFTNTSPIVIPATAIQASIGNLTINGAGGVTLGGSQSIATALTLTSGTLTVGGNTLSIPSTLTSLARTTGTIDASNANALLSFTNTSALSLPSGLFTGNINALTINGAGGVTLGSAITVTNLNLSSGVLTNSTFLTMSNSSTIVRGQSGSATSGSLSAAPTFGTGVNISILGTAAITSGNELPTGGSYGTLTINNTASYSLAVGISITASSLVVGSGGVAGVFQFASYLSGVVTTLNVTTTVTIGDGATFQCGTQGATVTHSLNIGGNISIGNGSTFNMTNTTTRYIALTLNSSSASDQTISSSGTPTSVTFGTIILSRGNSTYKVVCSVAANATPSTQIITYTNGTWEQSAGTLALSSTGTQILPSTGRLILSGSGSFSQAGGSTTINGPFTLNTSGSYTMGSGNSVFTVGTSGAIATLTAGTLNINGRLVCNSSGLLTINGGTVNIPTGGTVSNASNSIFYVTSGGTFNFSSGAVNVKSNNIDPTVADIQIQSNSGSITGGTITVSDVTVSVNCAEPLFNFAVENGGGTAIARLVTNTLVVTNNLTINSGTLDAATNNINVTVGGSWQNSGTYSPGSNTTSFNGSSAQTITKTGGETFNALTINNSSGGVALNSAVALSGNLNLTNGTLNNSTNNITLANGITIARAASAATLSAAPVFGTTVNITYTNSAAIVTANELPNTTNSPLTTLNNLTINSTGTATVTLLANAASIQINGVLALSGSTTGTFGVSSNTITFAGTSSITRVGASISINASNASAVLVFANTSAISIPANALQASVPTLTINGVGGVTLGNAITVTNLNLTSGVLTNASFLTLAAGGTITRSSGSLTAAPVFGTAASSRVNVTITGNCTSDNELAGTTGGIGTLTVNNNATYTLNADRTLNAISVASGATIDGAAFVLTPRASGTATIAGTFKTANLVGFSGSATAAVSSTNGTTFTLTGSTIEYSAASASQAITTRTDYNNLTLSGGASKTLAGDIAVAGALKLSASSDKLSIGSNILSLNGSIDAAGAGFITGSSSSNISIGGTGSFGTLMMDQSVTDVSNMVQDLTMNRTGQTATLGNAFRLGGVLTPTAGTIASIGNLTIASTASNTARIAQGSSSGGYITGNVTVERYISSSGNRAYRLITPSVNTSTSINANWQEGQSNANTSTNMAAATAGYGTHITGTGGSANGFDATITNQASLYIYNPATPSWDAVTNTNVNTLSANTGYLLFIRGNRDNINVLQSTSPSSDVVLRTTGTLPQGDTTFNGLLGNGSFNLVTNRFASPILWDATTGIYSVTGNANSFENAIHIWDPNVGSRGGYVTIQTDGTITGGGNLTREIQSGQAFFVQAKTSAGSPTLNLRESHKSSTNNLNVFRSGTQTEILKTLLYYTDNIGTERNADGVTCKFNNNYSNNVDGDDALQIDNWDEDVAIKRGNKSLSIEARNLADANDTIPLAIARLKTQAYKWKFVPQNFIALGLIAQLRDNFTNTNTIISLTDTTVINFIATADAASKAANRFSIVFKQNNAVPVSITSIKAYQKNQGVTVEWITQQEINMDSYEVEKSIDGITFSKIGSLKSKGNPVINSYNWFDATPVNGYNYYRIKSIEKSGKELYTQVLKVLTGKSVPSISVYPNPVTGNQFTLQLNNLNKGIYTLSITNSIGQELYQKNIEHSGGSSVQIIGFGSDALNGIYNVKVVGIDTRLLLPIFKK